MLKGIKILVFLLIGLNAYSQGKNSIKMPVDYVRVGVFFHSIGFPLKSSNKVIGFNRLPGISLFVGKRINNEDKRVAFYYELGLLAYHQKKLHYGYELKNNIRANINLCSDIYINSGIGLSYLHTFEDAPLYRSNQSGYEKNVDFGRSQAMVSSLLGIGIKAFRNIDFITNYQLALQMPFASKSGVFFIPHNRVFVGTKINF